jgi:L-fucose isomerase-like protein
MNPSTVIVTLPVGEFDTELVKNEFEAQIQCLKHPGINLVVADPVSDAEGVRQFVRNLTEINPDLVLIIPLRGLSAQVIEAAGINNHIPCLIWPTQGRFALPSSALSVGALRESGVPVELLYAPPGHPGTYEKLRCVTRAAKAFSRIRRSCIGIIGGLFPNLVACRYDPEIVNTRLGVTLLPITFDEIRNSMQRISQQFQEIEPSRHEIIQSYAVNAADTKAFDTGLQLHLALKLVAQEKKIDGFAAECWSGFPKELGLNPCMGFIDEAYTLACEGDVMLCISLLLVKYLTNINAYVGDLYDVDLDGILTLIHCGAPASLASNPSEVVLAKSPLALERGFETMTCRPRVDPGPVTLFRFYGRDCDRLHLASGEVMGCERSSNVTLKVKLNGDRWDFLEQCFGNHYLAVAGDIRSELKLLGKWLGIAIFET